MVVEFNINYTIILLVIEVIILFIKQISIYAIETEIISELDDIIIQR